MQYTSQQQEKNTKQCSETRECVKDSSSNALSLQRKNDLINNAGIIQRLTWTQEGSDYVLNTTFTYTTPPTYLLDTDGFPLLSFNVTLTNVQGLVMNNLQIHIHIGFNLQDCSIDLKRGNTHLLFYTYSDLIHDTVHPDLCRALKVILQTEFQNYINNTHQSNQTNPPNHGTDRTLLSFTTPPLPQEYEHDELVYWANKLGEY